MSRADSESRLGTMATASPSVLEEAMDGPQERSRVADMLEDIGKNDDIETPAGTGEA